MFWHLISKVSDTGSFLPKFGRTNTAVTFNNDWFQNHLNINLISFISMPISCVFFKEVYHFLISINTPWMKYKYTFFLREYVPGTRMATLCSVSPPSKKKNRAYFFFMVKIVQNSLIFKIVPSNLLLNSVIRTFPAYELRYVVPYDDFVGELPCL